MGERRKINKHRRPLPGMWKMVVVPKDVTGELFCHNIPEESQPGSQAVTLSTFVCFNHLPLSMVWSYRGPNNYYCSISGDICSCTFVIKQPLDGKGAASVSATPSLGPSQFI